MTVDIGFMTACLRGEDLSSIVPWAKDVGFDALEVAAWPVVDVGPASGLSHIDVARLTPDDTAGIRHLFASHDMSISAIGYYENNLHQDARQRAEIHDHLRKCIDAAQALGCGLVGTFIGRDVGLTVSENLAEAERILPSLVNYAADRDVRLVVENCPMEGWHSDGYPANLAYSPELWEWMFSLGFFLNFDPSHLVWLGIDPVEALKPYVPQVLHAQAKDTQVDPKARNRFGFYGRTIDRAHEWDVGWWRYRVPGRGSVDWASVVDTLYEGGFAGTVSIEHEDPVWGGSPELVRQGLEIGYATLRPLIIAPSTAASSPAIVL